MEKLVADAEALRLAVTTENGARMVDELEPSPKKAAFLRRYEIKAVIARGRFGRGFLAVSVSEVASRSPSGARRTPPAVAHRRGSRAPPVALLQPW